MKQILYYIGLVHMPDLSPYKCGYDVISSHFQTEHYMYFMWVYPFRLCYLQTMALTTMFSFNLTFHAPASNNAMPVTTPRYLHDSHGILSSWKPEV